MKSDKPGSASLDRRIQGTLYDVVKGGYCVGCGACAAVAASPITMKFLSSASYEPDLSSGPYDASTNRPCPFLAGPDEDELGAQQYAGSNHNAELGWYRGLYAGFSLDRSRDDGSSGGLATWLLAELLRRKMVTAVIHVRAVQEGGLARFSYCVSTTEDMVCGNAKTRYYPVEMSEVMARVRATSGRYAFVGVPCYVKAVRRLMLDDQVLRERITYALSLFCGHMKSGRFAESLAWQMGWAPETWRTVDFRRKIAGRPASAYGFAVQPRGDGNEMVMPIGQLEGHDWGMGLFRLSACEYCDDVVGETADASFGDAWLPAYVNDSAGTSLVIVRHRDLQAIFEAAKSEGRLALDGCTPQDMVKSQEASFRHRRAGLAYRLWLKDKSNRWRPIKRVAAQRDHISPIYRLIFRYRMFISSSSHWVFAIARKWSALPIYTFYVRVLARLNKSLIGWSRSPRFTSKP